MMEIEPYNASVFFDSFYRLTCRGYPELASIGPLLSRREAWYHYSQIQYRILETLGNQEVETMLDVGTGAGFLVSFYLEILEVRNLYLVELSQVAINLLRYRYGGHPDIIIRQGDISSSKDRWQFHAQFDLITAIGVLFHIVDDARFECALKNLAAQLKPNGLLIASDEYGESDQDKQHHCTDSFATWDEFFQRRDSPWLLNKRTRGLAHWNVAAKKAGLELVTLHQPHPPDQLRTPENAIGVWVRSRKSEAHLSDKDQELAATVGAADNKEARSESDSKTVSVVTPAQSEPAAPGRQRPLD